MKAGFYPALGTPFDELGNFIPGSFMKHVEDQVAAGAAGLLVMGSMGIEPCIRQSEYTKVASAAANVVKGRCPLLVGVMDNSIGRILDKIDSLKGLMIDGVVATTPYYYAASQDEIKRFFTKIADKSPFPLYLYDLPVVTKTKIFVETAECLMKNGNIKGIKTGDIITAKELTASECEKDDFNVIFSGLDIFDVAYNYGIKMNLDGMFSCTPGTTSKMYKCLEQGDIKQAGKLLADILALRNEFVKVGVFCGFTYAMNLLGYEGIFAPDYIYKYCERDFEKIHDCMKKHSMI
jgi:4-hydroxy-tetrahydrodipicolinate synthase